LENQIPGRIAVQVTALLRGKQERYFLANFDLGSQVVLINASKVKFTGNKLNNKFYYNHSGYPGGLRKRDTKTMLEKYPVELMRRIV
jgi:large subunit ribosomal protein L13